MAALETTSFLEEGTRLTREDFERVRALIYDRAGITLGASKQTMVQSRLARRLRETGHRDFTAYLDVLGRGDPTEWQAFVNALTTNLTSFFREAYHFPLLAEQLKAGAKGGRQQSIWCSAASTGEEPYTLAMTAIEALGPRPAVKIFASDIDTAVLDKARRGVYPLNAVESIGDARLQRFFLKGVRDNEGMVRVRPELSALLTFGQVNLAADTWPFREQFDVIFCRNVMIYFNQQMKQAVLERMHRVLKPGGLLFVGHSENFTDRKDIFVLQGKTVYRRVG